MGKSKVDAGVCWCAVGGRVGLVNMTAFELDGVGYLGDGINVNRTQAEGKWTCAIAV